MKKNLNVKGFGGKEVIIILLLLLILIAIGVWKVNSSTGDNDYKAMKIQADNFVKAVTIFKDKYTKDENIYFLYDLTEGPEKTEITDPNNSAVSCDIYESFVEIKNPKHVILKCGSVLVDADYLEKYDVYEVGDWQEEQIVGETGYFYNYFGEDEELKLNEFLPENEFIKLFNEKEGCRAIEIEQTYACARSSGYTIKSEMLYRTKKLVKQY